MQYTEESSLIEYVTLPSIGASLQFQYKSADKVSVELVIDERPFCAEIQFVFVPACAGLLNIPTTKSEATKIIFAL